ncbi:MAG: hypothetical protein ABI947_14535, partial [Chloroflexota bacterium]
MKNRPRGRWKFRGSSVPLYLGKSRDASPCKQSYGRSTQHVSVRWSLDCAPYGNAILPFFQLPLVLIRCTPGTPALE